MTNIINYELLSILQITIHNSVEELKKFVSPDVLPLDYGGTFPKTSEEITGKSRMHPEIIDIELGDRCILLNC